MNIKLITIDMDGTLLNSQGKVSEGNQKALRRALDAGIYIVPATGRVLGTLPQEVKNLDGVSYFITSNGAAVYKKGETTPVSTHLLDVEKALFLLNEIANYDVVLDVYIDGVGYYEKRYIDRMSEFNVPPHFAKLYSSSKVGVSSLIDFVREKNVGVEKINLPWLKEGVREKLRDKLMEFDFITITSSLKDNLELNSAGVDKGKGLASLCELLGIETSQTMAIGDNFNDVGMLIEAGCAVVMGNGEESIQKDYAQFVTKTNDEDGVAYAIEQIVFEGK